MRRRPGEEPTAPAAATPRALHGGVAQPPTAGRSSTEWSSHRPAVQLRRAVLLRVSLQIRLPWPIDALAKLLADLVLRAP